MEVSDKYHFPRQLWILVISQIFLHQECNSMCCWLFVSEGCGAHHHVDLLQHNLLICQTAGNESKSPSAAQAGVVTPGLQHECGYYDVEQVQRVTKALLVTLARVCVERSSAGELVMRSSLMSSAGTAAGGGGSGGGATATGAMRVEGETKREMLEYLQQQSEVYASGSGALSNSPAMATVCWNKPLRPPSSHLTTLFCLHSHPLHDDQCMNPTICKPNFEATSPHCKYLWFQHQDTTTRHEEVPAGSFWLLKFLFTVNKLHKLVWETWSIWTRISGKQLRKLWTYIGTLHLQEDLIYLLTPTYTK